MSKELQNENGADAAERRGLTVIRSIEIPGPRLPKLTPEIREAAVERARRYAAERESTA
jgi:hypothetical protein